MNKKDILRNELNRVPKSVMSGGIMTVSLWKAKAEKAKEVLQNEKMMQECFETGKQIAKAKV